jgi:hypothetical protein
LLGELVELLVVLVLEALFVMVVEADTPSLL